MQNQKPHYVEAVKEIGILTVAVAIIAAAVFFFSGAEPHVRQQHFRFRHRAVQFHPSAAVGHYDGSECGAPDHRVSNLRKRIWRKDRLYEYPAATIHRAV